MTGMNIVPRTTRVLDPFRAMKSEMDRMFDEFFAPSIASGRPLVRFGDWRSWEGLPRVDIVEHPTHYTLRAEVPGFSKDDIQLNCTENSVTLKGEYKEESEAEGEGECYVCQESALGSFERTIGLPGEINVEGVKATLKDGVLTLHLPKKEVQHLKQIEVQAA